MYNPKYNQSNYDYRKKNLRRVTVDFPFPDYDRIKAAADGAGLPVNTWIKSVLFAALDASGAPAPAPAGDGSGDRSGDV